MSRSAALSFAWPAVTPSSRTVSVWSPERSGELESYLAAAREHMAAGRPEDAVDSLEAALHCLPGMPVPRREAIVKLIHDTAYAGARRALQAPVPDLETARSWLQRIMPTVGLADDRRRRDALRTYGLLLHLSGRPREALPYYRAAFSADERDSGTACAYGEALARLQMAASSAAMSDGVSASPYSSLHEMFRAALARPVEGDALSEAAWRRLAAMDMLLRGDAAGALAVFPGVHAPSLPRTWALEGALLGALCARWPISMQYYRRALAGEGPDGLRASDVHRFVLLAAALECIAELDPAEAEALVLAPWLPARPPRSVFPDAAAYRAWADHVRRRQHGLWIRRALRALPGGDHTRLRRSLRAIVRLQPRSATSRWIGVWLACTAPSSGAAVHRARSLKDSAADDGSPHHLLRLSALAAERFGAAEEVVTRLSRLLQRFPRDPWGLARWRAWMLKLADEAVGEGRFRQALSQYASLVLYAPDDAEGWLGCAAMWELMGDDARAADCRRQARRANKLKAHRAGPGSESVTDEQQVLTDILRELLAEPSEDPPAAAALPISKRALLRAVADSLRSPDVYLRVLLERWAGGATNLPSVG